MGMKVAYVMVGLPASGKSTLIEETIIPKVGGVILSTDNVIEGWAKEAGLTYDEIFDTPIIEAATMQLQTDLSYHMSMEAPVLIWDQTNLYLEKRLEILETLQENGYTVFCICFEVTPESVAICKERIKGRRGKELSDEIIDELAETYERPTSHEGFAMVTYIDIGKDSK